MSGTNTGGPNFNRTPADLEIWEWMWWRWKYYANTDTWEVLDRLESPSEFTPGLVYFTPIFPTDLEPPLTYEWWWIPHILDPIDQHITTHGKMHVRDRSKTAFNVGDPENISGGEWVEISLRENTDPSNRGPRGFTIWASHGPPAQDLDVGTYIDLPYDGDVDDILGDFYIDLDQGQLYGPKYINQQQQEDWGDGISILGPPFADYQGAWQAGNAYKATAPIPYDNTIGKHDIVTHTPWNSNVKQTFLCIQDVDAYTSNVSVIPHRFDVDGGTYAFHNSPTFSGLQFFDCDSSLCGHGDYLYVEHQYSNTSSKHYWFYPCPQVHDGPNAGDCLGDGANTAINNYSTNQNAPPVTTDEGNGTVFDINSLDHHIVQFKCGGTEHGEFRVWVVIPQAGGNWSDWFPTAYTGASDNTDNINDEKYITDFWSCPLLSGVYQFRCIMPDLSLEWVEMMEGDTILTALYYTMKTMGDNFRDNNNSQLWGFNMDVSYVESSRSGNGASSPSLIINDYGAGTATGYPQGLISAEGFFYREPDCDGNGGNDPGYTISTLGCYRQGNDCVVSPFRSVTTMYGSSGIPDVYEPFWGSLYWDVILGIESLPAPIAGRNCGVYFGFGGFPQQQHHASTGIHGYAWWKDYKTFYAFTEQQKDISMQWVEIGMNHQDGDQYINKLPEGQDFHEWGVGLVEPWWRTVGRNYDGSNKVDPSPPTGGIYDFWLSHGDTIEWGIPRNDDNSVNANSFSPIPAHFICLKPGNKYKITFWAEVTPQYGPFSAYGATSYIYTHWGAGGYYLDPDTELSTSPLETNQDGWYELSLMTIPSQLAGEWDIYGDGGFHPQNLDTGLSHGTEGGKGYPVEPWYCPWNTILRGTGTNVESYMPSWDTGTNPGGNHELRPTVAEDHILSRLDYTFTTEDWLTHPSSISSDIYNIGALGGGRPSRGTCFGPSGGTWDETYYNIIVKNDNYFQYINGQYFHVKDNYEHPPLGLPHSHKFVFDSSHGNITYVSDYETDIGIFGISTEQDMVDQIAAAITDASTLANPLRVIVRSVYAGPGQYRYIWLEQMDAGVSGDTDMYGSPHENVNANAIQFCDFGNGQDGLTYEPRPLMKYKGSTVPTWDSTNHRWDGSLGNEGGYDGWMRFNQRHNSKFRSETIIYSPTSEGVPGAPGNSWIGVYFDASWWADTAAWKMQFKESGTGNTAGWWHGTMCKGLMPFYPRSTMGNTNSPSLLKGASFEIPREVSTGAMSYVTASDSLSQGGGLMIELIEQG